MREKLILRTHAILTKKAQAIFGDLVESAMVGVNADAPADCLEKYVQQHNAHEHRPDIDLDFGVVVLLLRNGRLIRISSSEWGEIAAVSSFEMRL